jgi:hypothetical protein
MVTDGLGMERKGKKEIKGIKDNNQKKEIKCRIKMGLLQCCS